jgi:hypothetical protein
MASDAEDSGAALDSREGIHRAPVNSNFHQAPSPALAVRTHCMWEYLCQRDSTRLSIDELKEAEVNEKVRALTFLLKKSDVPKVFGTEPFRKARPRAEVRSFIRIFLIYFLLTPFFYSCFFN